MFLNATHRRAKQLSQFVLEYSDNDQSRQLARNLNIHDDNFDDFYISLTILNTFVSALFIQRFVGNQEMAHKMNNLIADHFDGNRYRVFPFNVVKAPDEIVFYRQQNLGVLPPGIDPYQSGTDSASILMTIYKRRISVYHQIAVSNAEDLERIWLALAYQFYRDVLGSTADKSSKEIPLIFGYLMMFGIEIMKLVR